jgi:predicted RNA binding protein YcfA (HicA-like mRNA interferase family)
MSRLAKILERVLRGTADANIDFAEVCRLLRSLGFTERVRGSHHIFSQDGVREIINLQPKSGGQAKAYQVRQVRELITSYGLGGVPESPFLASETTGDAPDSSEEETDAG